MNIISLYQKTKLYLLLYLFLLLACLALLIFLPKDLVFFAVNGFHNAAADYVFPYITLLGEKPSVYILALLLSWFSYRKGLILISSLALSGLVTQLLKQAFNAPRPYVFYESQLIRIHFIKGVVLQTALSFPSGHTTTAFGLGIVLAYLLKNKAWAPVILLFSISVAYSRMYLGQHFFEDVIAGSVIGTFISLLWISWLDSRPFMNKPAMQQGFSRLFEEIRAPL
jgi:membrane-associated phospholipid phosphatase